MSDKDEKTLKQGIVIAIIALIVPVLIGFLVNNLGSHDMEEVRAKMEEYLFERYGEEFVVDRIGTSIRGNRELYQARIYPRSIIGTNRENDNYYYASATIEKLSFGRLGNPGDSYSYVMMNTTGEEYILPEAKQIFGERILLKVDSEIEIWGREDVIVKEYKKRDPSSTGVDAYIGYKERDFRKAIQRVRANPDKNKLFLNLYIYIFDKIESEEEKEERREQIFDFVQYLKKEGLYEYLELGVIFIDERVLAPSYKDYSLLVRFSDREKVEIEGENVYLPPMELRKEMSEVLQEEIEGMSEEELLESMGRIKKSELSYEGIRQYNGQYQTWVYSINVLEEKYSSSIIEEDRNTFHDNLDEIKIEKYKKYMYINKKGE